jgi:hypothetical protein
VPVTLTVAPDARSGAVSRALNGERRTFFADLPSTVKTTFVTFGSEAWEDVPLARLTASVAVNEASGRRQARATVRPNVAP